jgi:hypothetical protein
VAIRARMAILGEATSPAARHRPNIQDGSLERPIPKQEEQPDVSIGSSALPDAASFNTSKAG